MGMRQSTVAKTMAQPLHIRLSTTAAALGALLSLAVAPVADAAPERVRMVNSRAAALAGAPVAPPVFAPTSVWNQALPATARLDPRSSQLVSALNNELSREVRLKIGPWINTTKWSVPVYTVGPLQPRVRVVLDTNKPALQRDFESVPIPPGARASAGTDANMVVYQPATDTLWEFYRAHQVAGVWHARWGGKMANVSTASGIFPGGFGASASSLAILGGLVRISELEAGQIDHALALALPTTAAGTFTWPAQRTDGRTTGPNAIPEGTHFRIDPSLDLGKLGLSPAGLAMARAAQRYGIIVRDGASNITFYAEDPTPTGANPYPRLFRNRYPNDVLRGFPWNRLQVVAPRSG